MKRGEGRYRHAFIMVVEFINYILQKYAIICKFCPRGLKDLQEHKVMRTRSMPESTFDIYQPLRHPSEHSMFYTPRLGRSSIIGKFCWIQTRFSHWSHLFFIYFSNRKTEIFIAMTFGSNFTLIVTPSSGASKCLNQLNM